MTKYMIIGLVILGALLAGMTKLYLDKRDDFATAKSQHIADRAKLELSIQGLEQDKVNLKAMMSLNQERLDLLAASTKKEIVELERRNAELDRWRTTLANRTLAKPEVTRRAARRAISRRMQRLCKSTGGDERDCASPRPPGTSLAAPNRASTRGDSDSDARPDKNLEPGDRPGKAPTLRGDGIRAPTVANPRAVPAAP